MLMMLAFGVECPWGWGQLMLMMLAFGVEWPWGRGS